MTAVIRVLGSLGPSVLPRQASVRRPCFGKGTAQNRRQPTGKARLTAKGSAYPLPRPKKTGILYVYGAVHSLCHDKRCRDKEMSCHRHAGPRPPWKAGKLAVQSRDASLQMRGRLDSLGAQWHKH